MASADAAGHISAAVRAALLANAPRRTVSVVAAAVVSAVVRAHAKAACQTRLSSERAGTQRGTARCKDDDAAGCPAALLEALRAARASQMKGKKERRRGAKTAASTVVDEKGAQIQATFDREEARACMLPVLTWRKKEIHRTRRRRKRGTMQVRWQ